MEGNSRLHVAEGKAAMASPLRHYRDGQEDGAGQSVSENITNQTKSLIQLR